MRFYSGNTLTVASENTMTKIVVEVESKSTSSVEKKNLTVSEGSVEYSKPNITWKGSAKSVVFSYSGTAFGVSKITINYADDAVRSTVVAFDGLSYGQRLIVMDGEEESFVASQAALSPADAGGVLTYRSDNPSVAAVNSATGEVTFGSWGTAKITASFAGSDAYAASSASYTVWRTRLMTFYESFDQSLAAGGNDGNWTANSTGNSPYDNDGWTPETIGNPAYKCIVVGTKGNNGSVTTPSLGITGGEATLTFKAGAFNTASEGTKIKLTITDGSLSEDTVTTVRGAFTTYSIRITGGSQSTQVTFAGAESAPCRFYLDEVAVFPGTAGDTVTCPDLMSAKDCVEGTLLSIGLHGAQVVYVDGDVAFVRDGSGAMAIQGVGDLGLAVGDMIEGKIVGTLIIADDVETVSISGDDAALLGVTGSETVMPVSLSSTEEVAARACDFVKLTGTVRWDGEKAFVTDALGSVELSLDDSDEASLPYDGAVIDVEGIAMKRDEAAVIRLQGAEALVYVVDEKAQNVTGDAGGVDVRLVRTLDSSYWNTFCVPFTATATQVEQALGEGVQITQFIGQVEDGVMFFEAADCIEAGCPYLVKPAQTVANPVFSGVDMVDVAAKAVESLDGYAFVGIYSPTAIRTDGSDLFIATDGSLKKPTATGNVMNGMRAYISLPEGASSASAKISIGMGEATGISSVEAMPATDGSIFSLDGRFLGKDASVLSRGVYIRDGKKFVSISPADAVCLWLCTIRASPSGKRHPRFGDGGKC